MNITQLKYFNAVCTYKTVSAAAEFLFVSQPTISSAIKELEEEFGVVLFKRQHRSMVLTNEGELLHDMSRDLISRVEQIEHIMNEVGKNRKTLRLGVPPMIGSLFLPHIYQEFHNDNSSIKLELFEGGKNELISKLRNNYLDMIFLPHDMPLDPSFSTQHIARIETVFCVSKHHRLSMLKTVTPTDLTETPLILFQDSFFQTEVIKRRFSQCGVSPKILLQTEQLSNVFRIIENNTAAGFLFKPLTQEHSELAAISMQEPLYVDVSLMWKKDTYLSGSMKSFIAYMDKLKMNFMMVEKVYNKMEKDVYIASSAETGGIYHYKIADGNFRLVGVTRMPRPMYMIIEKGKMYIILRKPFENGEGGMVVYDIDADGNLINPSEILSTKGEGVCHIMVHNDRVYCANYVSGSAILMPDTLVQHSGCGPNPDRQEGPHVHYVGLTPDKKYITVTDLGLDTIFLYHPDMTLYDSVKVPAGHGVRHLAFSEDGKYMFAINELQSTVAAFSYEDEKLRLLDVASALPNDFAGTSSAAAIRIRDGKIYVSNRGHDSIGVFTFEDHKLQLIQNISCEGKHPRDFIFVDQYMLSTNMDSDEVAILDSEQDYKLIGKLEMEAPLCALVRE